MAESTCLRVQRVMAWFGEIINYSQSCASVIYAPATAPLYASKKQVTVRYIYFYVTELDAVGAEQTRKEILQLLVFDAIEQV